MSAQSSTSVVAEQEATTSSKDMSLEQKIGMAKKFDREMKDYAKATVKEFLGIYGYEEDVEINMDDSETQKCPSSANTSEAEKPLESNTTTASTSACEVTTGSERPVSSVSISSSSAANGNADMTRFCITMSIPRPGADSLEGYTTLRFWNCIMCSTAFVGTKPEIIQRVHHPQLFTYQPEWLSHAGICNRCQKDLTMQTPKITIYAISKTPQVTMTRHTYHHGYNGATPPEKSAISETSVPPGNSVPSVSIPPGTSIAPGTFVPTTYIPGASVPVVMCNAFPGQCNCAHGVHNHVTGIGHYAYTGVNLPVVCQTETKPAEYSTEPGYINMTQYTPITCTN